MAEPDNTQNDQETKQQREQIRGDFSRLFKSLGKFVRSVLSLRQGADKEGTMEGIRQDVEFRGPAAWILVCSTLIASVGLGENNIPVIVGAMLISPLMGPILGVGLASGTNDFDLLKKSLTNFAIAIVISLVISTLYFLINPVFNVTAELASRKQAVLTAILIAFVGGAAGIIAGSRSLKNNVVPGVAIATALMPPLCTAGYGLATWQMDYFLGAMYLFLINSVFIAVPTYLYIRYMNFPRKEFMDPARETKIKRYIAFFLVLIVVPSAIGFWNVYQRSRFERSSKDFIAMVKTDLSNSGSRIISSEVQFGDSLTCIRLDLSGKNVSDDVQLAWTNRLKDYNLAGCNLEVYQNEDPTKALEAMREQSQQDQRDLVTTIVQLKDERIDSLENELQKFSIAQIDYSKIAQGAKLQFPDIQRIGLSEQVELNFQGRQDTIATVMLQWTDSLSAEEILREEEKLQIWLLAKLDEMEIHVSHFRD